MVVTKAYLRQELQNIGFKYRDARKIVSSIFELLSNRLKKDGKLDLPFGTLTLVPPKPQRHYRLGKIVKTGTKNKVHYRKPKK